MEDKKKTLLEQRIEQFCKSSGDLLAGINEKYSSSNKPKKKKRREVVSIPDMDIDFHDEEPSEGML